MQCPHRVWRDIYGPQEEKIKEVNPFVQMLWDRGSQYEKKVISDLGNFIDISTGSFEERFKKTKEAMDNGEGLIYQGVLIADEIMGIPDLLKKVSYRQYLPIDIKSGMGVEGVDEDSGDEGKLKKHYAVQIALYIDALKRLGYGSDTTGVILDIKGNEVVYDLSQQISSRIPMSYWGLYEQVKNNVAVLMENQDSNKPALAGNCKLCPWYSSCKKWVKEQDDPTGLFYVGRSKRDILSEDIGINKIDDILEIDINEILERKKNDKALLKGVGDSTLQKMIDRAKIIKVTRKPVVYGEVNFPETKYELFFDIEDDPTQEFVYLHGVYERSLKGERYLDFTATNMSPESEKKAWAGFWEYIRSLPKDDFSVYYYSAHEKTTYKRMQKIYPDIVSVEEVEEFFNISKAIDLYSIVLKSTDWPVGSYSIKEIATFCGFSWRDKTPSGALSIQWFNEYIKTGDKDILKRILEYNEDDCKATMVVKDKIKELSINK
jgi:predicted RecB family nuclease